MARSIRIQSSLLLPYHSLAAAEAGIDEAGRGCGAGPVVAAAVILPATFKMTGLRDSKKMPVKLRDVAAIHIKEEALAWSVGIAGPQEIDAMNILEATYLAMHRAIKGLLCSPGLLLIDGNKFKNQTNIPHETIIGGDDLVMSIAAASVLAKTSRDLLMYELHTEYPQYGWNTNKGYLTAHHRQACRTYGLTRYHRHSFAIL